MLLPADAAIAARDHAIPGLSVLLDPDNLSQAITDAIGRPFSVRLRAVYVRYKPGTSCTVAYQDKTADSSPCLYAKAYATAVGDKAGKFEHITLAPTKLGFSSLALDQDRLAIMAFPNDAHLRVIQRLYDNAQRATLLATLAPGVDLRNPPVTLRYKPERRYVGRIGARERAALVRIYSDDEFNRANANAKSLTSDDLLHLPRRLGNSQRHRTLVLTWTTGESLETQLLAGAAPSSLERVGAALFRLHQQRAPTQDSFRPNDFASAIHAAARFVSQILPDENQRMSRLASECTQLTTELPWRRMTIHRDFGADQVILRDQDVGIIDLDQVCIGEPALDAAMFAAKLHKRAELREITINQANNAIESFIAGYEHESRMEIRAHVRLLLPGALLLLTPEPFRHRSDDWPAQTRRLLDAVETPVHAL